MEKLPLNLASIWHTWKLDLKPCPFAAMRTTCSLNLVGSRLALCGPCRIGVFRRSESRSSHQVPNSKSMANHCRISLSRDRAFSLDMFSNQKTRSTTEHEVWLWSLGICKSSQASLLVNLIKCCDSSQIKIRLTNPNSEHKDAFGHSTASAIWQR